MKLTPDNLTVCINTYKRPDALRKCLKQLRATMPAGVPIVVISNHSKCDGFYDNVDVGSHTNTWPEVENSGIIYNAARPDESWGHLSRSWNQCMYTGLRYTENVLFCQDDVEFKLGWWDKVNESMYDYYCAPIDGQIQLMSREAFLKVGWYDERFVGIDFEGYDYLNRVIKKISKAAMIEDKARDIHLNTIGLSDFWIAHCDDEADRPRGEEKAHARMNRYWLAKKRGLSTANPRCHKDGLWRAPDGPYIEPEIDWYPWFTAKMQNLTGVKQTFCEVPYMEHYGHDGYDI